MEKNHAIVIIKVGNGFEVLPDTQDGKVARSDILVFGSFLKLEDFLIEHFGLKAKKRGDKVALPEKA